MSKTQPARGMRDFLPSDVRKRNYVINIIKEVYESYGFEPLETPSVENLETLTGKYGEEGNQLIFKILKRGEKLQEELSAGNIKSENELSDLALRYDLTVPLARVVANNKNELPKFFKRYQIQPVWRADRPARGRYREFYQCDVDAIGSKSMIVEAELCTAVSEILERLGFKDFIIRVNHRQLLFEILNASGVVENKQIDALIALDKLDKIGREGVTKEFIKRGVSSSASEKLLFFFESLVESNVKELLGKTSTKKLIELQKQVTEKEESVTYELENAKENYKLSIESKNEIENIINQLDEAKYSAEIKKLNTLTEKNIEGSQLVKQLTGYKRNLFTILIILDFLINNANDKNRNLDGISALQTLLEILAFTNVSERILIDSTLVRGLSYYTGAIFEINVPDLAGSLGGGGRYDGLIGMFGKEEIPACGFSLGLERILVVMEERGMFPKELSDSSADVLVTVWNEETAGESLKLANEIREKSKELIKDKKGLRVLVYPETDKLGKQFKYADSINIPYVCVLGETEIAENTVTLKNLRTGVQETVSRSEVAAKIASLK